MAVILEAAYSKKLGLPNFSSHSYVVSIRTELKDISQVAEESGKLYQMLQEAVDREIEQVGFLPDATVYGMNGSGEKVNGNGHHSNGNKLHGANGNGEWACSEKQKDLVLKFVHENNLDKGKVEDLAREMFDKGVKSLNRLEASGLIDELFARYSRKNGNGQGRKPFKREYSRR